VGREGSGEKQEKQRNRQEKIKDRGGRKRQEKGRKSALPYLALLKNILDLPLLAECIISIYQNRKFYLEWHSPCDIATPSLLG